MDLEKFILLVKDHQAIYNACPRNRDYIASVWVKTAQEMGAGKWNIITVISSAVLLLLLLLLLCLMLA
jgi:hypothetical protein